MSVGLVFRDTAKVYAVRKDGWGKDVPQPGVDVPAIYEQSTSAGHGDGQDFVASDGRLFLPADNQFLRDHGYRLEGMVVEINVYGYEGAEQFFKIATAIPVRDTLLDNKVQHVECSLEKVESFDGGAIS